MEKVLPSTVCSIATAMLALYLFGVRILLPVVILGWPVSYSHEELVWNVICLVFTLIGVGVTFVLKKKGM